jgi:hypothetical protein
MNRMERRGANVASAAVLAAFLLYTALGVATSGPPEDPGGWLRVAISWTVFAAPSALAARILWRAWWARTGARLSTMDPPARLLATAVASLPADRADWGAAMTAELDQVRGRGARWWFAAGCARTAMFPPRGNRLPVLVVAALATAAAVAAGLVVGRVVPGMGMFAASFVALAGAMATVAVARVRRLHPPASGPAVAAAGVAGVAACIVATGYMLRTDPSAARALGPAHAIILAVVLAGCLWLALAPPRGLASSRLARRVGLVAALALGAGLLASARVDGDQTGVMGYAIFAPVAVFFLGSVIAAAVGRSLRVGVQAAVWTALQAGLLLFAVWLVEAVRWYRIGGSLLLDGEDGHPLGVNLNDAVFWVLVFIPAWALPFGVFGAAIGSARWRRRRPQPDVQPTPL